MKPRHAFFVLGLGLAFSGCRSRAPSTPPSESKEAPPLPADVEKVVSAGTAPSPEKGTPPADLGGADAAMNQTGEFISPHVSELASKLPGRVGRLFVDEGAHVEKGQPLLEIETDYFRIEVQRAEADKARAQAAAQDARRDFDRKKDLVAKGSVSKAVYERTASTFEQADAAVRMAEASLALARQRLEDATLRSPLAGCVLERHADLGERLGDNTVAFVIVQMAPLKLRFRLPERYLGSVRMGQLVQARVEPYPDEVFEGRVAVIVQAIDAASRSFVVEAEFQNRDGRLRPGLFARVALDLAQPRAQPVTRPGARASGSE